MKLTHLFNNTCTQPNAYWPSCSQHPKTLSFRSIASYDNESFNNIITTYCNDSTTTEHKPALLIHEDLLDDEEGGVVERVIRGFIKSDRLFFEPVETNSILSEAVKKVNGRCSSGSDIMEMKKKKTTHVSLVSIESLNPYLDFKKSMEEMVEAQYHGDNGVKQPAEWDWLQELLGCYLKVNGKSNHEYIIEAFVDIWILGRLINNNN